MSGCRRGDDGVRTATGAAEAVAAIVRGVVEVVVWVYLFSPKSLA